jgi:hypothetical protein
LPTIEIEGSAAAPAEVAVPTLLAGTAINAAVKTTKRRSLINSSSRFIARKPPLVQVSTHVSDTTPRPQVAHLPAAQKRRLVIEFVATLMTPTGVASCAPPVASYH